MPVPAVILAEGALGEHLGKAANDLVMYNGRLFHVVAVIDSTKKAKDAGDVLEIGRTGVPVVASLDEALDYGPRTLILGTTPIGGKLDECSMQVVEKAILNGLDVWSGMHNFLTLDPRIQKLAAKHGARIVDLRKPPSGLRIWSGEVAAIDAGIVTVMGTDCGVGKNITTVEIVKEASRRRFNPGIVATGQTMMMLGADAGSVIDAIPADFTPGEVEKHVLQLSRCGKDLIVVEGQASITHPGYGQVSLAILYGSQPDAVVLAHDPFRKTRHGFNIKMPTVQEETDAIELLCPKTKVVALSLLNWRRKDKELHEVASQLERESGMPAENPRERIDRIFDAIVDRLEEAGKLARRGQASG